MNYKKVNQLAFKNYYGKEANRTVYGMYGEKVCVCDRSVRILLVPEDKFVLDVSKLMNGRDLIDCERIIRNIDDYKPAVKTKESLLHGNGDVLIKVECGDCYAWFNVEFFKEFNPDAEIRVKSQQMRNGKEKIFSALILEYDEVVGLLLPVNVKEASE